MTELVTVVDSEIDRLETALRADPRFRKLTLLRGLQLEYAGDADEDSVASHRRIPALPPPRRKGGRKRKANGRAAKAPKPVREKKPRARHAASADTSDFDNAVLSAIKQLQGASTAPTFAAIEKIAGGYAASIGKAVERLAKQGLITPEGGRQNRTYLVHRKSSPGRVPRAEPEPEPEEPVEEAVTATQRPLIPLPEGYDLDQFRRSEREVLCGLLSAGDGSDMKAITKWAEVEASYIPMILVQLKRAELVTDDGDGWSFTDLGYAVAKAVHAEERE